MGAGITQQRAGELDGIRALCVIAVIFSHTISEAYQIGLYQFFEFGAYGVYIFFILSGYLITGQLLATQEKRREWHDTVWRPLALFYGKRMLRLFPAYYVAISGAVLLNLPGIRDELPWHVAQLSDILFARDPNAENSSAAGHFWSLTVEWQFYLVWPLAIFLTPARWLPWLIALVMAVSIYSWAPVLPMNTVLERSNILQSLDSLGFGAALAWAEHRRLSLAWFAQIGWAAAGLFVGWVILMMLGYEPASADWLVMPVHEALNLAFTAIIYRASTGFAGRTGALLDAAPLRYIGRISYGIYVYHMFAIAFFEKGYARLGWGEVTYGALLTVEIFITSTIAAALSWRFMEQPVNNLRGRLAYNRPSSALGDRPIGTPA